MRNPILILTAFLLLNFNVLAQKEVSHFMTMTQGYSNINSSDLSTITPTDARSIGNNYLTSTINLRTHINRYIIGFEATMARDAQSFGDFFRDNTDPATANAKFYNAGVQFGYAVLDKPNMKLYPIAGVGMGQATVNIDRNKDIDASQIKDGENQGTTFNLKQRNFNTNFGVGFDYIVPCKKKDDCNPDRKYGFVIGAKAGYNLAFDYNGWEHNGGNVNGGPNFSPSGFYAGITLGFVKTSQGGMFNRSDSSAK